MAKETFILYVIWVQNWDGTWTVWRRGQRPYGKPTSFTKRYGTFGAQQTADSLADRRYSTKMGRMTRAKYKDARVGVTECIMEHPCTSTS